MAYLYLLQDADAPLFKIGTAFDTAHRARAFTDPIDWSRSSQVEFPTREAAYQTEFFLHSFLKPHRVHKAHKRDGYTEWFDQKALPGVLEFLTHGRTVLGCAAIEPVTPAHRATLEALLAENLARVEVIPEVWSVLDWETWPEKAFANWLDARLAAGHAADSRKTYTFYFRAWLTWLSGEGLALCGATEDTVRRFLADGLTCSLGTRRRYGLLLQSLYAELVRLGGLAKNPVTKAVLEPYPESRTALPSLNDDEVAQLTDYLATGTAWKEVRDRAIAALALGAGLRACELLEAKVSDLAADASKISIPKLGPVFAHEAVVLEAWRPWVLEWVKMKAELGVAGDLLVPASRAGRCMSSTGLFRRVAGWFERAGLATDKAGVELLRNTFGKAVAADASIGEIQEWMGLDTARAVERYL